MLPLFLAVAATLLGLQSALAQSPKLRFVPVAPCRVSDTRIPGLIIAPNVEIGAGTKRDFRIGGYCGVPASARAFSINVTAIPLEPLSYLTLWPAGEPQPFTSLLNSYTGSVVAAGAIVKAGTNAAVSIFATQRTHIVIDVNGYFVESTSDLAFYPVTPCRVLDSRQQTGSLNPPLFPAGATRQVPVAGTCGIPGNAQAYALNFTVVAQWPLGFLTAWPSGIARPIVSTLNAPNGSVVANAAIVPAGTGGAIDVFVTDATEVVIDVTGYFGPAAPGGLSLYMQNTCRVADTRTSQGTSGTLGPPSLAAAESRRLDLPAGNCSLPQSGSVAYVLNATVVPSQPLAFLTLYPTGLPGLPVVSTLNSFSGSVVSNMAIVPGGTGGAVQVFVTGPTDLVLDVSGYFAP